MKYWVYFIIAGAMLVHPHLWQKLQMLYDYFTHPGYEYSSTFSTMDNFDLFIHGGIPVILVLIGFKKKKDQAKSA